MSAFLIDRANVKRAAMLGALGAALLLSAVPAQAQAQAEAQEEDNGYDIQLMRRVLSAVGLRDDKPAIEYRERSPLVIPPSATLPPPVAGGPTAPNWPVSVEAKEARARAEAAKPKPGMTGDPVIDDGRLLTPNELARGRAKRDVAASTDWTGKPLSNKELGGITSGERSRYSILGLSSRRPTALSTRRMICTS